MIKYDPSREIPIDASHKKPDWMPYKGWSKDYARFFVDITIYSQDSEKFYGFYVSIFDKEKAKMAVFNLTFDSESSLENFVKKQMAEFDKKHGGKNE